MHTPPSLSKNLTSIAVGSALLTALSPVAFAEDASSSVESTEAEVTQLDTLEITATSEEGVNVIDSTAGKMGVSIKDTARSVVKVSEEEINDLAATDIREASAYQAGFHTEASAARFSITRGIQTNIENFLVNGMKSLQGGEAGTGSALPSTYNLESVTFLSGADSILYGSGMAGGTISAVTKKPQEESETTLGVSTRSYLATDVGYFDRNQLNIDIDSTGKLVGDDVLYRVITRVTPDNEEAQDVRESDDRFIDASLTFKINDRTKITPRFEYKNEKGIGTSSWTDGYFSTNYINGTLNSTSNTYGEVANRSYYYGSASASGYNRVATGEVTLEHILQNNWLLNARAAAVHTDSETKDMYATTSSSVNSIGNTQVGLKWAYARSEIRHRLFDMNLEGKFNFANLDHHLIAGVNVHDQETGFVRAFQADSGAVYVDYTNPNNNINNPFEDAVTSSGASLDSGDLTYTTDREVNLYLKDRITINDLTVALGLGYMDYTGEESNGTIKSDFDNLAYDIAAIYKLNQNMNAFASYSQSYEPLDVSDLAQYAKDGVDYKAEESDNYEIGIKGEFLNKKLNASVAFFYIDQQNPTSTETDSTTGDTVLVQSLGDVFRSHGVEVNALYHFNNRFSSQLNYAYTDAHATTGEDAGKQAKLTPFHALTVWNSYSMESQPIRLALGVRSESSRADDLATTGDTFVSGYAEFDFGTYYETEKWDLSLVVKNLLDENRIYGTTNGDAVVVSDPRSINMNLKYRL
ncbi:TonB-dependent receptor [Marinomonas sp. C2222]|uniref:TonB-dependent receptor n=1 Tax=Marinomonas sargassi TaxID=2984494 RepID=A0ABT2YUP7_9GAMM|nr:TonB-dependent receptor [Marinomonas sargassi]MCV2403622.1 TonB-dependent receptor [Marinomonas sargassi]